MEFKAREIADILGGTVDGNPDASVTTFARIEQGKPGAICFFANPKYEQYVYECKAESVAFLFSAAVCHKYFFISNFAGQWIGL